MKWALHYFKFKHITEIVPAHTICDDELTPQKQKIFAEECRESDECNCPAYKGTSRAHSFEVLKRRGLNVHAFSIV